MKVNFCIKPFLSNVFGKFVAKINLPMTPRTPTQKEIDFFNRELNCIMLTRRNWCLSNLFIPKYWKHALRVTGMGSCVEATSKGVIKRNIYDRIKYSHDYMVILPKDTTQSEEELVSLAVENYIGREYDWKYKGDNDSLYCSELIYQGYMDAIGEFPLTPDKFGCQDIMYPNSLDNSKHFYLVINSEDLRGDE